MKGLRKLYHMTCCIFAVKGILYYLEPHPTFLEETIPAELLHGGKHFVDNGANVRTTVQREAHQSRRSGD